MISDPFFAYGVRLRRSQHQGALGVSLRGLTKEAWHMHCAAESHMALGVSCMGHSMQQSPVHALSVLSLYLYLPVRSFVFFCLLLSSFHLYLTVA